MWNLVLLNNIIFDIRVDVEIWHNDLAKNKGCDS